MIKKYINQPRQTKRDMFEAYQSFNQYTETRGDAQTNFIFDSDDLLANLHHRTANNIIVEPIRVMLRAAAAWHKVGVGPKRRRRQST